MRSRWAQEGLNLTSQHSGAQMDNRAFLQQTIEHEADTIRGIVKSYVVKFGLSAYANADVIAEEIFHDTVVEALRHTERYDRQRAPIPWLLGIAMNLIRMRRRHDVQQREVPIRDIHPTQDGEFSDDELFQRFADLADDRVVERIDRQMFVQQLLAHVSKKDREIIHLAMWHDLDSQTIGKQLNISPSAVRVRLHRAIKGLRRWLMLEHQE